MSSEFDLKSYLASRRQMVDQALEELLPLQDCPEGVIIEAMRYSLFAGGKRLRPILCLAAAEAVGGRAEAALAPACALEMIHTYSLIHDDLPAMDDDDLRRGVPTSHKVFGEAMAILAGDGLLTEAFRVLAAAADQEPGRTVELVRLISTAAGYRGMVGGQVVDMLSENKKVDLDTVRYMHRRKTGALLAAAVEAGGIAGGGSAVQVRALRGFGEAAGLAFQIADDILDIEGDTEKLGKQAGMDAARGKATYPVLMGLEPARAEAMTLVEQALAAIADFDQRAAPLRAIAAYIVKRAR